jgi:hypothetical protein
MIWTGALNRESLQADGLDAGSSPVGVLHAVRQKPDLTFSLQKKMEKSLEPQHWWWNRNSSTKVGVSATLKTCLGIKTTKEKASDKHSRRGLIETAENAAVTKSFWTALPIWCSLRKEWILHVGCPNAARRSKERS